MAIDVDSKPFANASILEILQKNDKDLLYGKEILVKFEME